CLVVHPVLSGDTALEVADLTHSNTSRRLALPRLNMRLVCALVFAVSSLSNAQVDTAQLKALKFRYVGPTRGGRVTTVTGVPQQPNTFYMGSTGGGVWKTTNAGTTWNNIS